MKSLVIAEKPSVASDIAKALGGFEKKDDIFEREDLVVASAVGHLLELVAPEEFEVKRGKWSFAHLPVLPPYFDLQPLPKSEQKLKTLARQIKRKDIGRIINACDAGREGELIFRTIVQYTKAKQPIARLWLQSMTPSAIREAFNHLRTDEELMPLADAARCRSEADWLVGINGTRAMTAFNSKEGGFFKTSVGRVQTPTLAIVVEREEAIRRFVSKPYFEVHARFEAKAGDYLGRFVDPSFKKDELHPEHRAERLWDRAQAEAIVQACMGGKAVVSEESKSASQSPPLLFDLTSLQREANSKFGFSAKNTLGLAQALYEKHKVLTYPRTDSKALPEDYIPTVTATLAALGGLDGFGGMGEIARHAQTVLNQQWVRPNKRIFDNTKVSDHFAIVPTGQLPRSLSEPEQKIFELVTRRFIAAFFPASESLVTTRFSRVGDHSFKTEGRVLVVPGWLAVYGRSAAEEAESLVAVAPGETPAVGEVELQSHHTKPPARYSEATLLSAMEGAGKMVEDDELREAMSGRGLGTPATRAAIIEGLLADTYLHRDGRELIPTAKAFQLMTLLRGLGIPELSRPELTGEWESRLRQIESGALRREDFMDEIAAMTERIVGQAKNFSSDTIPGDYITLATPCPACGGQVKENYRRFACTRCEFSITKTPAGRTFEPSEVETLLETRTLGPIDGFRSKLGRPFVASLRITGENKLEFDFGQGADDDDAPPPDFSNTERLGDCPKCSAGVYALGSSYICEKATGPSKVCDFKSGAMILQQTIAPEDMRELLSTGRTRLFDGFVSARTRRKFKAYLSKGPDGKIGFEFEARSPSKGNPKASTKSSAKAGAKAEMKTEIKAEVKTATKKAQAKKA